MTRGLAALGACIVAAACIVCDLLANMHLDAEASQEWDEAAGLVLAFSVAVVVWAMVKGDE